MQDWIEEVVSKGEVAVDTSGGYTYEQVMWSRNTSKDPQFWWKIEGKDKYLFRSEVAESWEFRLPFYPNPIRNLNQVYLYFLDSDVFIEPQKHFTLHNAYTKALKGTPMYENYWDVQEERCLIGYEVGGVRISARHYFMLNFGRMRARMKNADGELSETKRETFPSFVDFQYYLINEFEWWYLDEIYKVRKLYKKWFPLATDADFKALRKQIGAVPKARRKGLTYVSANAINSYNFVMIPESYNIIGAYDSKFYSVLLDQGIHPALHFINEYTPWQRRRTVLNQRENFRASFKQRNDYGIEMEVGYKSEINCISFGGTAFAGVGKSADSMNIEEAGKFDNLLDVYSISIEPLIKDGDLPIGSGVVFGTSGDNSGSGSTALAHIAYNPESMGFVSYENIYDGLLSTERSSIFIDALWFYPLTIAKTELRKLTRDSLVLRYIDSLGDTVEGVDNQGNSYRIVADLIIEANREKRRKGGHKAYENYITQYPKYLSEAFLVGETNVFDKAVIKEAKSELMIRKPRLEYGYFSENSDGKVLWNPDFSLRPILEYPTQSDTEEGAWIVFQRPQQGAEAGRYIAGMDPIDKGYEEASSDNKHSLGVTYIMDTLTGNIVAEYAGRPAKADVYYRNALRGLKYYGARVMYENNLPGFYKYCYSNKALAFLADEPSILKNKAGYKMGRSGTKGFHAVGLLNPTLRDSVAAWLDEDVQIGQNPETGESVLTKRYFTIESPALLDELLKWTVKGNFDRISALMALILYYEQTANARQYRAEVATVSNDPFMDKFRKKFMRNGK